MNKTKTQDCAFPIGLEGDPGLTKREYFAAMALQGLVSGIFSQDGRNIRGYTTEAIAEHALIQADELIKQLNEID